MSKRNYALHLSNKLARFPGWTDVLNSTRDEIKPVSNHSNNQTVWMVW
jgi:hypothetical protein